MNRDEPYRLMRAIEAILEFAPRGVDVVQLHKALSLAVEASHEEDVERRAQLLQDAHAAYAVAWTGGKPS